MFSLIITIISIALVAALALATIYYGGNAFNKGSAEAKASQLINEGQQINGAVAMYKADAAAASVAGGTVFTGISTLSALSPSYLAQVPAGWTGTAADGQAVSAAVSTEVCEAVNKKAGMADPATVVAGDLAGKVYGCVTGELKVTYKF